MITAPELLSELLESDNGSRNAANTTSAF